MSKGDSQDNLLESIRRERDMYADTLALSNAAFKEKVKELSINKRIGDSMRWNLDRRRICTEIVDIIVDETICENCSLWLIDPDTGEMELVAAKGQKDSEASFYGSGEWNSSQFKFYAGVIGRVAKTGKPLLISDVTKNNVFINAKAHKAGDVTSLLCLPIKGEENVMGIVNMSHPDVGAFTREDELSLSLITNQASLAFASLLMFERLQNFNERLEQKVDTRTRELKFSENKYRSFTEHAGDAIFVVGRKSKIIEEANGRACGYTGYEKSELVGQDIRFLFDDKTKMFFDGILAEGHGRLEGKSLRKGDGSEIFVDVTVNTITTQTGEVAHLIIRDVTHRLSLEAKLRDYSEHLEDLVAKRTEELREAQGELLQASKMAALGEMASGVAHEINNPLAVIRGYAENIVDNMKRRGNDQETIEDLEDSLYTIITQADKCDKLTSTLLGLARRQEMVVAQVNLAQVIGQSIHFTSYKAKGRDITIEKHIPDDLPEIRSDANMLEQILINLYNNALDAVGDVGSVTTNAKASGSNVTITVKDNGPGISAEDIKKIFTPFFTTKPLGEGTGLGLPMCQRLARRLRGRLSVNSTPGAGATFTIELPLDINLNNN